MESRETVALVLAGGVGARFWPLTTNKILFPFAGQALFQHAVISRLPKAVSRMVIVTSPGLQEQFTSMNFSIPHTVIVQHNPLGMGDAVLSAKSQIAGCSVLIIIADDLVDTTLYEEVLKKAHASHSFGVIPGWKTKEYFPGGYLHMVDGSVTGIIEKPGKGNEPSEYVDISGHFIRSADTLIEVLTRTTTASDDQYEKALTHLMQSQEFTVLPYEGSFTSLKYPWHVLDIMDMILSGTRDYRGKNVTIKPNVIIEGPVYIEDNVIIYEHTKITGPVYIGSSTIIGNNNIIRHSMIGSGCVSGFNTDITRSYVGDNTWFHSNYIGDSVLEGNISLGSGAVLANLRLDEDIIHSNIKGVRTHTSRNKLGAVIGSRVRIGVNASTMPGVKIGSDSFIGSGAVVDRDITDSSYCVSGQSLIIKPNRTSVLSANRDVFKKAI